MMNRAESAATPGAEGKSLAPAERRRDFSAIVAVLVLVAIAVSVIAHSWTALSTTIDEPDHIWCGIEWIQKGACTFDLQHPPLARMAVALGPYLKGLRSPAQPVADSESATFQSSSDYKGDIAAARSGNLPFFLLACLVVFLWSGRWFSRSASLCAVALFATLPPILGHAALATTDMACCATVALALYAFLRCVENPSWQRLVLLAAAMALAVLSKFSSIAFLGACFLSTLVYFALVDRRRLAEWRRLPARIAIVCGIIFVLLWAGYRFARPSLVSISTDDLRPGIDAQFAGRPFLRDVVRRVVEVPLPLSQIVEGLRELQAHNVRGHESYLFGRARGTGWWYFFPVVLALKTPIAFLILAIGGIVAIALAFRSNPWQQPLTVIFALVVLLICMSSRINLGVRHILAIYPLLAVIGGNALSKLFAAARRISPALALVPIFLAAWLLADFWMARSDDLAYFNYFAGAHPERILAESDLDWGQDLYRLSARLRELHADHVSLMYFGGTPLDRAGLPSFSMLSPDEPPAMPGYVAVSVRYVTLEYAAYGTFAWLQGRTPLETVGKSIYLYKF